MASHEGDLGLDKAELPIVDVSNENQEPSVIQAAVRYFIDSSQFNFTLVYILYLDMLYGTNLDRKSRLNYVKIMLCF